MSTTTHGVGILAIGSYLPAELRRNDWWPADVVARWTAQQARGLEGLRAAPRPAGATARRVVDAILGLGSDPFEGAVERHILAADQTAADLEVAAAEDAFARSGIDRGEIDLLLTHPAVPEYLLGNDACDLHHRLGLPPGCLSLETHASAYSFLAQLALAVPLIESGRARRALLVQSSAISRITNPDDPMSARCGDAATAVIIGPVGPGHGVLGAFHCTDGRHPRALIASVPGGRWYDGASVVHVGDPDGARRLFLESIDQATEVIAGALTAAGRRPDEVGFFAMHQATSWLGPLVQEYAGLGHARALEQFARTAYVFATSLPLTLAAAEQAGALASGDLAVLVAGGSGMIRGATVLRWGTAPS